ncbi:hypothetical protein Tco_1087829 [Tanacetum coccineum]
MMVVPAATSIWKCGRMRPKSIRSFWWSMLKLDALLENDDREVVWMSYGNEAVKIMAFKWKALDFAALDWGSLSFFIDENSETAMLQLDVGDAKEINLQNGNF